MGPTEPGAQQGPANEWAQKGPGPNMAQQMNGLKRARAQQGPMNPLEWVQDLGPNRARQMCGPNRARDQQGPMNPQTKSNSLREPWKCHIIFCMILYLFVCRQCWSIIRPELIRNRRKRFKILLLTSPTHIYFSYMYRFWTCSNMSEHT